jgi:guanylate kinase
MTTAIDAGSFIEHALVHGNWYGTSAAAVARVCDAGRVCVLDIDMQGVRAVKEKTALHPLCVFIAPPSVASLEARLRGRHTVRCAHFAMRDVCVA